MNVISGLTIQITTLLILFCLIIELFGEGEGVKKKKCVLNKFS